MSNGTAAARGAEHLMQRRDTRLRSFFTALDAAHLTWCLLRGSATLLDGSGRDVDLLLRRSHLASFEDLVFGLGGVRLPSTHPWHRFYSLPVDGSDSIKLDVVTGLIYSRDLLLASGLEDGCLERRRHDGRKWVLDATDMFWTVLLHCLLDKQEVNERRRVELQLAHDAIQRPSAGEDFFAALCPPGWSPDRALACVAQHDWHALAELGHQLVGEGRRPAAESEPPRPVRPTERQPPAWARRALRSAYPVVWRGAGLGVIPPVIDALEAASREATVLSLHRKPGWCDVALLVADDERARLEALLRAQRYLSVRDAWVRVARRGERVRLISPSQLGLSSGDLRELRSRSLPIAGRTTCRRVPDGELFEVRTPGPRKASTRYPRARRPVTISFSGLDGAGKSSQIDALRAHLGDRERVDVIWLPFKFWPPVAKHWVPSKVRRLVRPTDVTGPDKGIAPSQEDRRAHLEQTRPSATDAAGRTSSTRRSLRSTLRSIAATLAAFSTALSLRSRAKRRDADVLVLDRYRLDSAMKLQYAFPRVSATRLARIVELLAPRPDLEVFCRVAPEVAYERKAEQWTLEDLTIQARLYDGLTARCPTVLSVDATRDRNEVAEEIWRHVRPLLDGR